MTNKRKVQRFKRMQAKNSKERRKAEKNLFMELNKKHLYYDPIIATLFYSDMTVDLIKKKINALISVLC